MDSIPNFTPADIETVRQLVHQRYRESIQIQLADSELMLDLKGKQPADCPTLFWHVHSANFSCDPKWAESIPVPVFLYPT